MPTYAIIAVAVIYSILSWRYIFRTMWDAELRNIKEKNDSYWHDTFGPGRWRINLNDGDVIPREEMEDHYTPDGYMLAVNILLTSILFPFGIILLSAHLIHKLLNNVKKDLSPVETLALFLGGRTPFYKDQIIHKQKARIAQLEKEVM